MPKVEYQFSRELVDGDYNINNPKSRTTLVEDIKASNLPGLCGVRMAGTDVFICFDPALSPADQSTLEQTVTSHKSRNDKTPGVPDTISARQIRLQLVAMGVAIGDVTAAINALPEPDRTVAGLEWEYATAFERHNPLITAVGAALGLTAAQLDQIWLEGSQL